MKFWNIINGQNRKLRLNEDFEELCRLMMDDPSFDWKVNVALDNEFYSRLGMSAEEVASGFKGTETEVHNQKTQFNLLIF